MPTAIDILEIYMVIYILAKIYFKVVNLSRLNESTTNHPNIIKINHFFWSQIHPKE